MRDYEQWHRRYDDPTSDLAWRLRAVHLGEVFIKINGKTHY